MNEAMKMALEALTNPSTVAVQHAIALLQEELAKPEQAEKPTHTDHPSRHWDRTCPACLAEAEKQEPVAWMYNGELHIFDPTEWAIEPESVQPLYTAPPKREWVGLTSEELAHLTLDHFGYPTRLTAAIEALLKERNT